MDPYLRKRGRQGTEQRTRYPCPATLANGAACPGTIRGTHNRGPTNQKKKEQAREAAALVAAAANRQPHAAATQPKPTPAAAAAPTAVAAKVAAKPGGLKILVKGTAPLALPAGMKAAASQHAPVRNAWTASPGGGAAVTAAAKLGGGRCAAAAAGAAPPTAPSTQAPAKPSGLLAPEPVVRQRIIPGLAPDEKPKPVATLEQQRAMVAALRAQAKEEASRGKKAQAAAGAAGAAAAGARVATKPLLADALPAATARQSAAEGARNSPSPADGGAATAAPATPAATPEPATNAMADDAATDSSVGGSHALDAAAFEAAFRRALGNANNKDRATDGSGSMDVAVRAEGSDGGPATATADGHGTLGAYAALHANAPADADAFGGAITDGESDGDADPDPIAFTDDVYCADDGVTLLVLDVYGNYVRAEDVYGADPEVIGVQDERGNVKYCVAIRRSRAEALEAAHAAAAAAEGGGAGVPVGETAALVPPLLAVAPSDAHVFAAASAADDLDLLSLLDLGAGAAPAALQPQGLAGAALANVPAPPPAPLGPSLLVSPAFLGGVPAAGWNGAGAVAAAQALQAQGSGLGPGPLLAAPAAGGAKEPWQGQQQEDEGDELEDLLALCLGGGN